MCCRLRLHIHMRPLCISGIEWVDLCFFDKPWQNYPSEVFLSAYGVSEANHVAQKALQTLEHGTGQKGVFPVNVNLSAQSTNVTA